MRNRKPRLRNFQRLQQQRPESFPPGQLRTLQRRVKEWRTAIARRLVPGAGSEAVLMHSIRAEESPLIEMGASPQTPGI